MKRSACMLTALIGLITLGSETTSPAQAAKDEETLWNLERSYWRYVQDNDLTAYANLWDSDFLGWPSISAAPVRRDHITEWITTQTSKGLAFKTVEFKPAAIHVTGDLAMVYYWVTFKWTGKDGDGPAQTIRITHAWLRFQNEWHIIGGMSMPEPNHQ